MIKFFLAFLLSVFFIPTAHARQDTGGSLGDYTGYSQKAQCFTFHTTRGTAQVTIYSPTLFKISVWQNKETALPSYAVVGKPQKTAFSFQETRTSITLKTDSLTLEINKFPLRFTFLSPDGKIISTEGKMGTYWLGPRIFVFKHLFPQEIFTGLGEKTGPLNRRGHFYTHWNTDNPHYENWDDPLYSSIPFYMGRHNGLQYGIFVDNTGKTTFNFGAGNDRFSYFSAPDDRIDYYFFYHRTPAGILKEYSSLTGHMVLPPLWALGFQQSRWSYTPDKEVMEIATAFHDKKIPLDVLYLDIGYMDGYKVFTWNPKTFSHPGQLVGNLMKWGIHTAVIIDPGIKKEKGYAVWEDGEKRNCYLKYPDGTDYSGQVWPGWCNFPDFTSPEVRTWWGKQFEALVKTGVTGFWNDMNEIAVWGKEVPPVLRMNWEGKGTSYLNGKNVYGMQMARATYEGVRKLMHNRRPLVLTRSGYAGLQRYTAIWTGDNQATDDHMLLGIRLVNSFGLSGVPFAGYDAGGFGGDATPRLYARWVSLGAFSPFFRVHSSINTKRSEPWSYGIAAQALATRFIRLRYHLLPYIYAAFYEASRTGMPVQRSLGIAYPADPKIYSAAFQNQYLFGPSLLVIPAKSTQTLVRAYLPKGKWYFFYNDKEYPGGRELPVPAPLDKLPVFVKAGAIIPVQKQVLNTAQYPGDTLEIHFYRAEKTSRYTCYEDDGTTYDFENGDFYLRTIQYDGARKTIVLEKPSGKYHSRFKVYRFVFHGFQNGMKTLQINGHPVQPDTSSQKLFLKAYEHPEGKIFTAVAPNTPEQITLKW